MPMIQGKYVATAFSTLFISNPFSLTNNVRVRRGLQDVAWTSLLGINTFHFPAFRVRDERESIKSMISS
jgi:hypothetical protein